LTRKSPAVTPGFTVIAAFAVFCYTDYESGICGECMMLLYWTAFREKRKNPKDERMIR